MKQPCRDTMKLTGHETAPPEPLRVVCPTIQEIDPEPGALELVQALTLFEHCTIAHAFHFHADSPHVPPPFTNVLHCHSVLTLSVDYVVI
jgi:hypothetical protein